MRRAMTILAVLLPLGGCYVQPGAGYGYAQPGYPYGTQPDAYSGYEYNGGSPYMDYEGSQVPLVVLGGFWGYHDREGRFRRAPEHVGRSLESRHPQGEGVRPWGGQRSAPAYSGGGGAAPANFGGGHRQSHEQAAPPVVHSGAPVHNAPRQEERRGEHRCPQGQTHC